MKPYSLTFMCLIFLSVLTANVTAQADKSTRPSPPMEVKGKLQGAQVNISYSSPSVKGRTISLSVVKMVASLAPVLQTFP